ncbi:MAG: methyltransferase domain-containing protein [Candidatus Omnitrophica bacterium]|nr:methyltransferase domain-containing protein [Candidatus Omnitrophota bacterium]
MKTQSFLEGKHKNERRFSQRIFFPFPVRLMDGNWGKTVDISETGLCVACERDIGNAQILALEIEFPFSGVRLRLFGKRAWQSIEQTSRDLVGVRFLNLKPEDLKVIREEIKRQESLNKDVVGLTNQIRDYLLRLKAECDHFDILHKNKEIVEEFLGKKKLEVRDALTAHFKAIFFFFSAFGPEEYVFHRRYYQMMLGGLLLDIVEVNRHGKQKPMGYAGDFLLINYYYDFFDKYLGGTSFERLINHYSLNLFISLSVVRRKEFFKKKIAEFVSKRSHCSILSVGSGSARELIELVRDKGIVGALDFECLDFEKEAIAHVKAELEVIPRDRKKGLSITYINKSLMDVIKEGFTHTRKRYDFVYSSGLFDYLSDRIAKRMLHNLYSLIKEGGELIITNASIQNTYERMYYEMLGEWELIYRDSKDLLDWASSIDNVGAADMVDIGEENAFLFLRIRK